VSTALSNLAGQVIVAGFEGLTPPESLVASARAGALGGWVLFKRNLANLEQVLELNRALLALHPDECPPLLALDQEGGRVARLGPPLLKLPPMRVLGTIDDPGLTREAGELLGRQLAALGFNLNFAPVLDVDSNPDNPVIGDRSFGRDPEQVVRHARAFAAGLLQAGVAACGKHFPGHGDTAQDSHLTLPRLPHALPLLEQRELVPFARLAATLPAIMTAHVMFEALDPERPATLSPRIVDGLLRGSLGFGGVVFSDDLEMGAIRERMPMGEAACAAIAAGCDVVLVCRDPALVAEAHAALIHRAEADSAFVARLQQAVARSRALRQRFPPRPGSLPLPEQTHAAALEQRIGELSDARR
jgi:beta-N-acetylhexosaminidase